MRVVGKHCESGDLVVPDAFVPDDLVVGDVLATPVTGAYGYAMASNYNKVPRPAVVFVSDGTARVVVRRETPRGPHGLDADLRATPTARTLDAAARPAGAVRAAACTVWR